MNNKLRTAIVILCVIGAALSAVSLRSHYSTTSTDYCDLNETFNCDLVNRSVYASVGVIPVALIGLVGYGLLFALSFFRDRVIAGLRLIASFVGLGFAIYLAYIEARVLAVWCLLCIGSLVAIAGISILSTVAVAQGRGTTAKESV
jgi:uncharacterized membrane protein